MMKERKKERKKERLKDFLCIIDMSCLSDPQTEDVLYASIDHGNISPNRPVRDNVEDNDCDYAVVNLPKITTDTAKHKINEDSSDDYVLMG